MFSFTRVKQKLLASFSVIILFIVGLGIYNYVSVSTANEHTGEVLDRELPLLIAKAQISYDISQELALSRAFILYGKGDYKQKFQLHVQESRDAGQVIKERTQKPIAKDWVDRANAWHQLIEREVFTVYVTEGKDAAMYNLIHKVEPEGRALMAFFKKETKERETIIHKAGTAVMDNGKTNIIIFIIVTLVVILSSIMIALFAGRMIAKPIQQITTRMHALAEGDLSQEPLEIHTKDEIGQLAVAANRMNRNMHHLIDQIGHVSHRVTTQSDVLNQSASEVKSGSGQIATTMEELAAGAESQANKSSQLSELMGRFTERIKAADHSSTEMQTASQSMLELAETGGTLMDASMDQMGKIDQIMQVAVTKMEGLQEQTEEISRLVFVVKEIADQTNLLALNAAIEAAHAGSHGKGFAVVANEVGKLADQVAQAVTTITDIVHAIKIENHQVADSLEEGYGEVAAGNLKIKKTSATFADIKQALTTMARHSTTISRTLSAITEESTNMHSATQEIAAVTEESAAGIEQTSATAEQSTSTMEAVAASAHRLAQMASELNSFVRQFKV